MCIESLHITSSGHWRQQPQPIPGSASSSLAPDAQAHAATKAGNESAAVIDTHHNAAQIRYDRQQLAPLMATAQKSGQNVLAEELPAIRLRTSFKRAMKGDSSHLMSGMHRSEWLKRGGPSDLPRVHDDNDSSVSSSSREQLATSAQAA